MDIEGWLRRIDLTQYAEMFRANDVDIELLGRLTNDDLKDIGVASFGHRKKLLEAIAEFGSPPAPPTAVPEPTPTPATVAPPPISASIEAAGERRHVTVMFCDLVDLTGIAHNSMPKSGATWLEPISTQLRVRSWRWAAGLPRSWVTG